MYSAEQLLQYVYPELAKQNSWKLPAWYYISNSSYMSELAESKVPRTYDEIVSENAIKRNKTAIADRTAWEVWTGEKNNLMRAMRLLGSLPEDKIDVNQYQKILEAIFEENSEIYSSLDASGRSSLNKMIRVYDFLRYGQKKTP